MKDILNKIKSKKPLDRLDNEFVVSFLDDFLKKNPKIKNKFQEDKLKKKNLDLIVKNVRNELNKIYGQFWLKDDLSLESHRSTKERLDTYKNIYKIIFTLTGKPKKILDLGCGLNPLTYEFIGKDAYFICTELTDNDCNLLRTYFKKNNIRGEVIKTDLRTYSNFPEVDICFMFKLLESLESKGHSLAEHLINTIKAKYIVISFSTLNIHGRRMNYPRRGWLEVMLTRLGYKFSKFEEHNEIFYVVKK